MSWEIWVSKVTTPPKMCAGLVHTEFGVQGRSGRIQDSEGNLNPKFTVLRVSEKMWGQPASVCSSVSLCGALLARSGERAPPASALGALLAGWG